MRAVDKYARELFAKRSPRCSCGHPAETGEPVHSPDCDYELAAEAAQREAEDRFCNLSLCEQCGLRAKLHWKRNHGARCRACIQGVRA